MVRQIASHSPAHQALAKKPTAPVSSAAAFAPLATAGLNFGERDVAKPKHLQHSVTASKCVPSTAAAVSALERAAADIPVAAAAAAASRLGQPPVHEDIPYKRGDRRPLPPGASVREAFDHFDANRSGFLDYRELRDALRAMGVDTDFEGAADVLRRFDDNADGKMDLNEFDNLVSELRRDPYAKQPQSPLLCGGVRSTTASARPPSIHTPSTPVTRRKALPPGASVREAFDHFDANRSGFLDYRELRDALRAMGVDTDFEGAADVLRRFDDNADGKMDLNEFDNLVSELRRDPYAKQSQSPLLCGGGVHHRRERSDAQADENRAARRKRLVETLRGKGRKLPHDSRLRQLVELDALQAVLGKGPMAPVRLVRAAYLVELWQRGQVLPCRQDVPDGYFYDWLPSRCEIVAISCPWLTDQHPDPWGHHLGVVAPLLLSLLRELERYGSELVVFWDYPCLFQETVYARNARQEESFVHGLAASMVLFAHKHVDVWLQTVEPAQV